MLLTPQVVFNVLVDHRDPQQPWPLYPQVTFSKTIGTMNKF